MHSGYFAIFWHNFKMQKIEVRPEMHKGSPYRIVDLGYFTCISGRTLSPVLLVIRAHFRKKNYVFSQKKKATTTSISLVEGKSKYLLGVFVS